MVDFLNGADFPRQVSHQELLVLLKASLELVRHHICHVLWIETMAEPPRLKGRRMGSTLVWRMAYKLCKGQTQRQHFGDKRPPPSSVLVKEKISPLLPRLG
jgi:hypothetical protein